jgi:hypothetical protein
MRRLIERSLETSKVLLRNLVRVTLAVGAIVIATIAAFDIIRDQDYDPRRPYSEKIFPEERPTPSQESIDLAMKIFHIETYKCEHPKYDPKLAIARGVMVPSGSIFNLKQEVFIGPSAFESWGSLGSTLAHELEVHCRQNIVLFNLKEMLGLGGIREAEFEAYQHEIEQAQRFQLSKEELRFIQEVQKDFIK